MGYHIIHIPDFKTQSFIQETLGKLWKINQYGGRLHVLKLMSMVLSFARIIRQFYHNKPRSFFLTIKKNMTILILWDPTINFAGSVGSGSGRRFG